MKRRLLRLARTYGRFYLVMAVIGAVIGTAIVWRTPQVQAAVVGGDGVLLYGASANTTPQYRTYGSSSNTFGGATGTVAGAAPFATVVRTSPIKYEAVAGYQDNAGTLHVMCYDGSAWTNDWSVTVAPSGTPTTRRFDIAYETNSGDVMVLYSTNASGSASLNYRTKPGTSGCNTGWSAAQTSLTPAHTTGIVQWVKLAWDRRATQNLLTAIWADANSDLSAAMWDGSAWSNEPTAALSTSLEVVTAAQDVDDFDVDYESNSGDVMVVWADASGANGTNGVRYATCTGGTAGCTWTLSQTPPTFADDATNLDLSANPDPASNEMVFGSIGNAGSDLQIGYWSGTAWTDAANVDTSAGTPAAGTHMVSTGWLKSGSTTRSIVAYVDGSNPSTSISFYSGSAGTFTAGSRFAPTPTPTASFKWFDVQADPFNTDRLMLTFADGAATSALYSKRLVMDATPTFTWTNADGGSLGNLGQGGVGDFSFAYWRKLPVPTMDLSAYRWLNNTDGADFSGVNEGFGSGSGNLAATALDTTGGYLYLAGNDSSSGNNQVRVEKRRTSDGALVSGFGTGGIVSSSYSGKQTEINAITIDTSGGYLYVGGDESDNTTNEYQWHIEKRSLATGALDTNFGTGGILTIDCVTSAGQKETVLGITVDTASGYLIAVGYQTSSGTQSARIEKRSLGTGAIGWTALNPSSFVAATAVTSDGTNAYVAGYDSGNGTQARVDKILISTGAYVSGFGTSGIQLSNINTNAELYNAIAYDGTNLYLAGRDTPSTDGEMLLEKRSASTGALVTSFNTTGRVQINPSAGTDEFLAVAADANAVYAVGRRAADSGSNSRWSVSKYAASNGAADATFGTMESDPTTGTDAPYAAALDSTGGVLYAAGVAGTGWRFEKRSATSGVGLLTNALGANDAAASAPAQGTPFRLRLLLHDSGNDLAAAAGSWKLQVAQRSGSTCEASGGGESYADVSPTSGAIRFYDNPTPADGATTTASNADPSDGSTTVLPQTYEEANNFSNTTAVSLNQEALFDFALVDNSAAAGTAYCFKVVNATDGSDIGSYSQIPMLTTAVPGPTTDQLMGGGAWFSNETKQPLNW